MDKFKEAMSFVFGNEGGKSDHPADRGGRTNLGITQATLNTAHGYGLCKEVKDVYNLTRQQAESIYKALYWDTAKCELMPMPLCVLHFDAAVNHGVRSANKLLQKALNKLGTFLTVDGIIGAGTISALKAYNTTKKIQALCLAYCEVRQTKFNMIVVNNPSQKVFLRGWTNRVNRNKAYALNKTKEVTA